MLPNGMNTYAGVIVAILPAILRVCGYDLAPGASEEINSLIVEVAAILGGAYAAYGRARAKAPGWLAKRSPTE